MKSVVLLSAGLDSTVNLYQALKKTEVVQVITFNYGQRAATQEIAKSSEICRINKLKHDVIDLPWFKQMGGSSLIDHQKSVPTGVNVSIDNLQVSQDSAKSVWVPNRNGIFLNIAAGFAESLKADVIIPGFNLEEATTFPDNSQQFMTALDHSLSFSTANHVKVLCYTVDLSKIQIVKMGQDLQVPFENVWPCYFSHDQWCGECESCQRSKRAFAANHIQLSGFKK